MGKKDRFQATHAQGAAGAARILPGTRAGAPYLHAACGNAGGPTPLPGKDGAPMRRKAEGEA